MGDTAQIPLPKWVLEVRGLRQLRAAEGMCASACMRGCGLLPPESLHPFSPPRPSFALQCGESDPDLFFTDRPRGHGRLGQRNREYVSIWADDEPGVLCGRSPMECYTDFITAFKLAFYHVSKGTHRQSWSSPD